MEEGTELLLELPPLEKFDFGDGNRERTTRRAVERATKNKGIKNKYLGKKNPFKK